jgi:4-carboxymuconolactone decarboxylase
MSRLEPLHPSDLDSDQRALYDAITTGARAGAGLTDARGALRGPFDALLRSPSVGQAVQELGAVLRYRGALPDDLRELAVLVAAAHWRCAFELDAHGQLAIRVGIAPEVVSALREGRRAQLAAGTAQRVVHDAAVELLETHRLRRDTYTALVDTVGVEQLVELLTLLGYYSLLAMLLESFEVRLERA